MASIFNLQILNDNTYNFATNTVLKKKGTPNQKRQFTNMKELITFLKKVLTIFGHCKYVRNHIRLYCNNPRYKEAFLRFKSVVLMLLFADLKFNKELNLAKNLLIFETLFDEIERPNTNDRMNSNFDKLDKMINELKNKATPGFSNDEWKKLQIDRILHSTSLKKLDKCVKNIQNCYQITHEKLLEHDYTDDNRTQRIKKAISNTARQHEAVLYYGFALNLKYIKEYQYYVQNDLIKKLETSSLFK